MPDLFVKSVRNHPGPDTYASKLGSRPFPLTLVALGLRWVNWRQTQFGQKQLLAKVSYLRNSG